MNNQFGFNSSFGSLTGNTVSETINNMNNYKEEVKNKYDTQATNDLEEQFRKLTECSFSTTDEKTKGMNDCGANLAKMEIIIKQAAEAHGSDAYKNLGTGQILPRYVSKNPKRASLSEAALRGNFPVDSRARQIGALDGITNQAQGEEIKYNPGKQEGKSFGQRIGSFGAKTLGWGSALNVGGWGVEKLGQHLQNRTVDKYTDSDANSLSRYYDYEKSFKDLNDKLLKAGEELAEKEELLREYESGKPLVEVPGSSSEGLKRDIAILKEKINGFKEELAHLDETSKYYEGGKPQTVRETLDEFNVGRGVEGAGEALSNARIYYAEELKPYLRLSKTEWNIPEILKSLTAKDLGIDEGLWQDAKALINKEIEAYAKDTKASLERVHEIMTDFKLSNKKIGGESADGVRKSMNDAIHTKLRNIVNQTLDAENPGFNANSKTAKYGRLLEGAGELKDKAIARGKSSGNSSFREDLMKLIRSPRGQKAIGKGVEWFGKHLKPTTYIKWLLDKIRGNKEAVIKKGEEILNSQLNNVKSNVESTVKNAKETVVKNTKNSVGKLKNKVVESVKSNPKSFRQPKLNFGAIFLWEALDKVGFEMPENVVTELAAYALEMNKLNKEGNRDLPLYDIENSYVNQNPRANMSLDEIAEYNEKNSTNYLNQLQQDVIGLDAFPDWFQERYGLYDDTTMEEQDWWKALEEEEEKNAKNYKDKIEGLTDEDWEVLLKSI